MWSKFRSRKIAQRVTSGLGIQYRLHSQKLRGGPDLVFAKEKKVIYVHGCFWHRHRCSNGRRLPKSKLDFWLEKLDENKKRDARNLKKLKGLGWRSLVIWECQL
ncbi:MAG: DNA mismatch endonuclease Vsr [Bdellovibrionota bacterium]